MFEREILRHDLDVRIIEVVKVASIADQLRVITFVSAAGSTATLDDFAALGTSDHVKMFFPDLATGILTPPVKTADGGIQRPKDAVSFNRDYTPLRFSPASTAGPATVDFEYVLHDNPGPATQWAASAKPGDQLAILGPRGSKLFPARADSVLLISDETGLPALSRWLDLVPDGVRISTIIHLNDEGLEDYLGPERTARANIEWLYSFDGPGQLIEAVRSAADLVTESTFVWAAGEATELVPVRRFLKYDLGLPRNQYEIEGYWKRGIVNRDHHDPIDPSDPDES